MKRALLIVLAVLAGAAVLAAVVIGAGWYNVAADEDHSPLVYSVLEIARERSIAAHARGIEVPDLEDSQRVRRGAGNYDAMCAGCHLAPAKPETEISVGLYPRPPDLTKAQDINPAAAFWVIKHGIKATGMPAWGKRVEDAYIWDMVAFLRKLPTLTADQYSAEVAASGGHSHGGGESMDDDHGNGEHDSESGDHSHDEDTSAASAHDHADSDSTATTHKHANGKEHTHGAPGGSPIAAVKALHEALSSGNARAVEDLLDPNVLILEGGNVERSRKEYASHHLPSDLKFMKSVAYELDRQQGDTVGDLAWVVSEARLTGQRGDKPIDLVSTETLVLKKSAAGWKVVHIHWSSRSFKP